ncbi:aldose epimerase family protein [Ralstonia sp. 1138]|uniref:aldose epimerase family protein n=1 Tax=Ralstonia sp. 1138 TaxID=3156423 RepID=UPI0033955875
MSIAPALSAHAPLDGAISSARWGHLPDGEPVQLFTLRNASDMRVSISDLGATLVSWQAPDRGGRLGEILLNHATPAAYLQSGGYLGGLIGRWANRIAGARFTLDGIDYALDRNEGGNLLHGGASGFHRALWDAEDQDGALVMRLTSPEGDAGFPGNVAVQVRYALDDDGTLSIDYEARTDAPTPVNLTSHGYFNLSGRPGTDIRGHILSIDADAFLEVDAKLIPTRAMNVAGTAFDFRQGAPIGARLDWPNAQLAQAGGFDHCFVLRNTARDDRPHVRPVARLYEPGSGRELTVLTDQRGLQFYSGHMLSGTHAQRSGLCLEASAFPNQVNMPDAEAVMLRPGQVYRQHTAYRVSVAGET